MGLVVEGECVVVEAWRRRGVVYKFEEERRWFASIRRGEDIWWICCVIKRWRARRNMVAFIALELRVQEIKDNVQVVSKRVKELSISNVQLNFFP